MRRFSSPDRDYCPPYSHSIVPQCPNCLSLNAYLNFPALLAGLWSARSLHY